MTYGEFRTSEVSELMVNGFSLFDYDTEENYSYDDRDKGDWIVKCIGVDVEEFVPAIYISET